MIIALGVGGKRNLQFDYHYRLERGRALSFRAKVSRYVSDIPDIDLISSFFFIQKEVTHLRLLASCYQSKVVVK